MAYWLKVIQMKPGWVYADLDLSEIARIRQQGQVFNYRDWPRQFDLKVD